MHDRKATNLVLGAVVASVVIADPWDGKPIEVLRSLRDDPLARMVARGQIDGIELMAGRHWQEAYERLEIGGARAIDTTREVVDGGRIPEPFTDAQQKAGADLAKAAKAIGLLQESVLRDVLARGLTMEQIAVARGIPDQGTVRFYGRLFRESLRTLSVVFGYAMEKRA